MFRYLAVEALEKTRRHLESKGYAVVRDIFDFSPINHELDWAISEGCRGGFRLSTEELTVTAAYVPMTTDETPASLELLSSGARLASQLLGRPVIPFRAKGTMYESVTSWHRDTDLIVPAVSLLAYLDPLNGDTGALRVRAGSHRVIDSGDSAERDFTEEILCTRPGDIIVLNERTEHSSAGGKLRRQWRVDYVAIPETNEEEAVLKAYTAANFSVGWDGGYDVDRFPTYGDALLSILRKNGSLAVLERSGALAAAKNEENFVRSSRKGKPAEVLNTCEGDLPR